MQERGFREKEKCAIEKVKGAKRVRKEQLDRSHKDLVPASKKDY